MFRSRLRRRFQSLALGSNVGRILRVTAAKRSIPAEFDLFGPSVACAEIDGYSALATNI